MSWTRNGITYEHHYNVCYWPAEIGALHDAVGDAGRRYGGESPECTAAMEEYLRLRDDIETQIHETRMGRRKHVTYPDGSRYVIKRREDRDYVCEDSGVHFRVWELVPAGE